MRVFTYPNPFEINKNIELWNIVTKYPHFCASDTLVQGLETEYGRKSFGILRTIQSLINRAMGEYTNNAQNDIQIFLTVSKIIRQLPESEMKTAFRFNIADVVEAVKLLIILECNSDMFVKEELSKEQIEVLQIYDQVIKTSCYEPFDSIKQLTKEDLIRAIRCVMNDEIEYLCNRTSEYVNILNIRVPIKTPKGGFEAISKIIEYLTEKVQKQGVDSFAPSKYKEELERAKYIMSIIENLNDADFEKIIVHGVHKITPAMFFLFKVLEKHDIEVIFLINYAKNLPNVYKTWREVYSFLDTKFEYEQDLDISKGNRLGASLASVIEGKFIPVNSDQKVVVYENLTSFTDREVRKTFIDSGKNLDKMQTQYYAVRGESSNDILKMYFPEQFKQKPFLSYPIGQFILGIYQMWDFEENTLCLSYKCLNECAISNLYNGNESINIFDILSKTRLYFSNIETPSEYYDRIDELETGLQIIFRNNSYSPLKKLSFFNISLADLNEFKSFIMFIELVANKLFKDASPLVDFGKHFKILMEIISNPSIDKATLSKSEHELINEISDRLSVYGEGEVIGDIKDVKDALHFYLSESSKGDTSNWIVRDFEQIDGAVLLRRRSKAKCYHFALLSNSNMIIQNEDVLPWPLKENMFTGYTDIESAVPVITKGLLERSNFLKFTLFYGTFFTKCEIMLSYISEENGEEQTPYYLLSVLGFKKELYKRNILTSFVKDDVKTYKPKPFSSQRIDKESKEMFAICPYKFLQKEVLKSPIEYSNDYHVKYFVANFMYTFIKGYYNLNDETLDLDDKISKEFENIQKLFPFWEKIVFLDIKNNTKSQLYAYKSSLLSTRSNDVYLELQYEKRKENFLIAQWTDSKTNEKSMDFRLTGIDDRIVQYMKSNQLYPTRANLPHKKVCGNCNFSDVCLRDYYQAKAASEGDE